MLISLCWQFVSFSKALRGCTIQCTESKEGPYLCWISASSAHKEPIVSISCHTLVLAFYCVGYSRNAERTEILVKLNPAGGSNSMSLLLVVSAMKLTP